MSAALTRDLVIAQTRALKLPGIARTFDGLARQARDAHWPHEDYLHEVLSAEQASRHESVIRQRLQEARFPEIKTLDTFLAYAVKVEEEASIHFDELGEAMEACGNAQAAALFRQLAGYSRLHLQDARSRASGHDIEALIPGDHVWPDLETPERSALWAGDPALSKRDALKAALEGERCGFEFYLHIAETSADPEIRAIAKEFVKEEAEHVEILERWIAGEETLLAAAAS